MQLSPAGLAEGQQGWLIVVLHRYGAAMPQVMDPFHSSVHGAIHVGALGWNHTCADRLAFVTKLAVVSSSVSRRTKA